MTTPDTSGEKRFKSFVFPPREKLFLVLKMADLYEVSEHPTPTQAIMDTYLRIVVGLWAEKQKNAMDINIDLNRAGEQLREAYPNLSKEVMDVQLEIIGQRGSSIIEELVKDPQVASQAQQMRKNFERGRDVRRRRL
jgi:hypothetical protein